MRTPRRIHERFLHFIWRNRCLHLDELKSLNGERIEILDIGVPNRDAGPDFHNGKIRIGRTTYEGDVEIHHDLTDWQKHFHSDDPRYNRVILHVVLRWHPRRALLSPPRTQSGREVPTLVLEPFLTEPLRIIWQRAILDERSERVQTIRCNGRNDGVPLRVIKEWIEKLAVERIELKIRKFDERMKELVDEHRLVVKEPYPRYFDDPSELPPPVKEYTQKDFSKKIFWEQLLYEGIMEGLGYSKNQEPFLRLARNLTLEFIRHERGANEKNSVFTIQAMLFGAAGLLPAKGSNSDAETRRYVSSLRRLWKPIRKRFRREILHEGDWQFFRLRPQNFPTVRLAAMSFLIDSLMAHKDWLREIIQTVKSQTAREKEKLRTLKSFLSAPGQGYWTERFTFGGQPHRPAKKLFGAERLEDIILNTIIPVVLLYARVFKDSGTRTQALKLYEIYPPGASNSILKTMQSQLLKSRLPLKTAHHQQGTIQLHKFFCAEERCMECEVGKIVFANDFSSIAT